MKRLLTAVTAIVAGALYFVPVTAHATVTTYGFGEGFSITDDGVSGDPQITNNLAGTPTTLNTMAFPLNVNEAFNLATFAPVNGSKCPGDCIDKYNLSDAFTVTFRLKDPNGVMKTFTQGGTFLADYNGALPCVGSDSQSQSQSDCVIWSPLSKTHDNNASLQSVTDTVDFGDGYKLNVTFTNAIDWNITPTVTFDLTSVDPVPEPA
jgi:hypothetical protein